MCGIAGIVGGRASVRAVVERMLDTMRHRGPDGAGLKQGHGATLGHRRLSIIDLEGGQQPIANEDGTAWVVCNGEIYNYRELTAELVARGHRFATASDTEVILHLYEEMGEACLGRLRGMFAFAIWDDLKRQLFIARDHLGQKPLFYMQRGPEFSFASEIKGLLTLLPGQPTINFDALHQYLSLRLIAPPLTMFDGVSKLPPGHYLTYSLQRGTNLRRYWNLHFEPKHKGSEGELLEALQQQLVESIRLHMVSDVPVGAFLSGGLDSTLVVALARTFAAKGEMATFTLGLPYNEFNEAPTARLLAARYGTCHHENVEVPPLITHMAALVHHLDEPSDPLSVCSYLISGIASAHVKVVLGGDGGDELFGGYDRYYGNLYAGHYAKLPKLLRRGIISPLLGLLPDGRWYRSVAHQLKWLHRASFLTGGERYAQSLGYFYVRPDQKEWLLGPELTSAARNFDPYAAIRNAYEEAPAFHPIDRMLYADSQVRLPDHPAMIVDRTSMAHGLEVRAPLMDHKLAEFAARMPTSYKVRWRTSRYAQRRLCERYVPREVLERSKQGFSSALPYLLRDEYWQLQNKLLFNSWLARDGLLLDRGIKRLVAEQAAGRTDHGNRLWLLINAEAWYRMKICGQSQDEFSSMIGPGSVRTEQAHAA